MGIICSGFVLFSNIICSILCIAHLRKQTYKVSLNIWFRAIFCSPYLIAGPIGAIIYIVIIAILWLCGI